MDESDHFKNCLQHTHALVRIAITERFPLEAAALT
jgi:hypothetical protein